MKEVLKVVYHREEKEGKEVVKSEIERNCDLRVINLLGGDEVAFSLWKKLVDYHKRSLVETAFFRLKRLFGDRLNNKILKNLEAETIYLCHALNGMNRIQYIK